MDYKKAGVDIEAGYKSVELMKKHVKETMRADGRSGIVIRHRRMRYKSKTCIFNGQT